MRIYTRLLWFTLLIFFPLTCWDSRAESSALTIATPDPYLTILGQQEYFVHQQLTLFNEGPGQPEKQNIWIALVRDFSPYQRVWSMGISPKDYKLVIDEYGNHYAEFDFSEHPPGTTKTVKIDYRVAVNELAYDLSLCEGELLDEFTQPELHIESANPQITTLASELSRDKKTVCQEVRAFYDYIGEGLVYSYNSDDWGAQAALGQMGADCTEYTSLFIALSRAKGIPARYFEGLLYLNKETDAIARIEHVWPDTHMPGIGWVALDPTLGRSLLRREDYFAHHTPDHIIVTMGPNPSTLRGSHYWTHLYWPGDSTTIKVEAEEWEINLIE